MPTVTTAPVSPLNRLRLRPLPPATAEDRARWRRVMTRRAPSIPDADAPDVTVPAAGIVACAPPVSFPIDARLAAWFAGHGGTHVVNRALRGYMRAQTGREVKRR